MIYKVSKASFLATLSAILGFETYSRLKVLADVKGDNDGDLIEDYIDKNYKPRKQFTSHETSVTESRHSLSSAIKSSANLCQSFMVQKSIPGLVVGVSYKGNNIWTSGFGFSNLEQFVPATDETIMRIASISKSITMLLVAKLVEEGKLDLDKDIHEYISKEQFPIKKWNNKQVKITLRQLVSHLAGIRHYKSEDDDSKTKSIAQTQEFEAREYYLKKHFKNVIESLTLFKDDDLKHEPGTKFLYTTMGWTLISAVIESVLPEKMSFENYLVKHILHSQLGMINTHLDEYEPIILNRSNYYLLNNESKNLQNAPYVDNSYKWAGGGLISNIPDLLTFGNVMLYSYKGNLPGNKLPGYLKQSTVNEMWRANELTRSKKSGSKFFQTFLSYGQGWQVINAQDLQSLTIYTSLDGKEEQLPLKASCLKPPFDGIIAYHSGAAVGASSALLILPQQEIVVAVFCNLQEVNLADISVQVAKYFENVLVK